jgi:hypothetical protein
MAGARLQPPMPKSPKKESRADPGAQEPTTALVPYGEVRVGVPPAAGGEQRAWRARHPPEEEEQDLNLVWAQLRGNWNWLVLVPAESSDSTVDIARSLSHVGARLSPYPIECIEASDVDLDIASRLVGRLGSRGSGFGWAARSGQPFSPLNGSEPRVKTLVALESPLKNSLALPVALAADGVVICIRRSRDKLSSLRETIDAVGADRIACCLLID